MMRTAFVLLSLSLLFGLTPACGGSGTTSGSGGDSGSLGSGSLGSGSLGSGSSGSGSLSSGGAGDASGGQATGGTAGGAGAGSTGSGAQSSGGGNPGGGGIPASGGASVGGANTGGASAGGGTASGDCTFAVMTNEVSPQMATVGVVEWSVDGAVTDAKIVFALKDPAAEVLNRGGEAPVDLERENYRTLLLGLKQESDYTFTIEATVDGKACVSTPYALPKTGTLIKTPSFSVELATPAAREPGFIITSEGYSGDPMPTGDSTAFIIDADSDVVWAAAAPPDCVRAKMDYEGDNLWMMTLNFGGGSGEMRYMSMDGLTVEKDIEGLDRAHHDFTVMPGGKVASMAWTAFAFDPESDLVIRSPDGTLETPFRIGANLYASGNDMDTYHANAIHYIEADDSFIISDRNPHLYVKVSSKGELKWQLGGDCSGAPAGPDKCSAQDWLTNHGHHFLPDGSFLLFNNVAERAHIFEFDIAETAASMTATLVKDYEAPHSSGILGDVQRLPKGNTLLTFSDEGLILEVDDNWQVVQTFSSSQGRVGYADFRPTLYGPPVRL